MSAHPQAHLPPELEPEHVAATARARVVRVRARHEARAGVSSQPVHILLRHAEDDLADLLSLLEPVG